MTEFIKTVLISLQFVIVTSLLSVIYGFIRRGVFTLAYVFNTNFLVGAAIIFLGLLMMFLPASFKLFFDKLTDHTSFAERYAERHLEKQKKAYEFLFIGISVIIITGIVQLLLSLLLT